MPSRDVTHRAEDKALRLPWLKRLTLALRNDEVRTGLRDAKDTAAIWRIVRETLPRGDA